MKKSTIVLSMGLTIAMLSAVNLNAQDKPGGLFGVQPWFESEGLFRANNTEGMEWEDMIPQDPTEEAPLGNGFMFLVGVGASYVIIKSKRGKEDQL